MAVALLPDHFWQLASLRGSSLTIAGTLTQVLLFPVVEELVFRRWLYRLLNRRLGMHAAAIAASLAFAAAHYQYFGTVYLLNVLVMGLVCQYLFIAGGRLLPAIACHATVNALVLLPKPSLQELFPEARLLQGPIAAVSLFILVVCGVALVLLIRRRASNAAVRIDLASQ